MARTTGLDAALASYMPWLRDRAAAVAPADEPRPVTFPTSPLTWKVEIALGANLSQSWASWAWTDITAYVLISSGISWSGGRRDEHSLVEAGTCSMTLINTDGRFSRRNPNSPYYGLLTKNTPIRVSVDPGSGFVTVIQMFVNNWPKRADKTGTFITSPIQGAGILRRLGQGQVAKSPLRRFYEHASPAPFARWLLEEPDGSTVALAGAGPDLNPFRYVKFGDSTPVAGAASGVTCQSAGVAGTQTGAGYLTTNTLNYTGTGQLVIDFWACVNVSKAPDGYDSGQFGLFLSSSIAGVTGEVGFDVFGVIGATNFRVRVTNGGSPVLASISVSGLVAPFDGLPHHIRVTLANSGANTAVEFFLDGASLGTTSAAAVNLATSLTTLTFPNVSNWIKTSTGGTLQQMPVTYSALALYDTLAATSGYQAGTAYAGEQAHARIKRVCAEDSIPIYCVGANSTAMGRQGVNTTVDILREAEASDLGVLYETGFGFGYQLRSERYNAPVGLALDFAQSQFDDPPADDDDDQLLRNQWTVTRNGGATKTASDATSIAANGLYADSATVSLYHDGLTSDAAHWRVHLGIVDQERWPALSINFASDGGRLIVSQWLALGFGPRVQIANPPTAYLAEPVDVFVEGQASSGDPFALRTVFNTTPFSPFVVLTVADAANPKSTDGREAHPGSTLTSAILAGDTSIAVTNNPTVSWGTASEPYDIRIGGERVTVTAVSGSGASQTLTVTRAVNGISRGWDAGTQLQIIQTFAVALWGA